MGKLINTAILMGIAALLIAGCGVKEGKVIDKRYEPAHTERVWVAPDDTCGIDPSTGAYGCGGFRISTESGHWEDEYHPAEYGLKLKDCSEPGECKTGWVSVSEGLYEKAKMGDFYSDGEIA